MPSADSLPLAGRTAIVTGASQGIGAEIARSLAAAGASLVITARRQTLLDEVAATLPAHGGPALTYAADLREPGTAGGIVEAALARFGGIHILVNNAGATKRGHFEALTEEEWQDGFALKFFGAVRLCRAAWPHLRQRSGSIVNIAGIGGRTPGAEFAIGGSVNAAMLSFTKALAEQGIADQVQVNAINPGPVRTARLEGRIRAVAQQQGVTEETAASQLQAAWGITRFGEPADVAGLVTFLVSPAGRWLQGSLIDLDGGQTKTI